MLIYAKMNNFVCSCLSGKISVYDQIVLKTLKRRRDGH